MSNQFEGFLGDGHFVGNCGSMRIFATKHLAGRSYFAGGESDIIASEEFAEKLINGTENQPKGSKWQQR